MTACTSFLAFFAEQTLAFAVKMHSRPDRWPQIVRFASGRADSLANRRFVNDLRDFERTFVVLSQPQSIDKVDILFEIARLYF